MGRLKWWKGDGAPVHVVMSYRGSTGVATLIIYLGDLISTPTNAHT